MPALAPGGEEGGTRAWDAPPGLCWLRALQPLRGLAPTSVPMTLGAAGVKGLLS